MNAAAGTGSGHGSDDRIRVTVGRTTRDGGITVKASALPTGDLLGRASELRTIDALLAGTDPAGPSLLLRGDPGVGQTALLDAAGTRATTTGARVLRAGGAPFEAGIRFSALHQMLYAARDVAGRLPDDQRDALAHVFGRAGACAADPLVLATAVLALVGEIAAGHPLLLVVDDVQWIDPASATVLGFLARRVGGTTARFLAAGRTGTPGLFDEMRLPDRTIGPLPPQAAAALLDARHPGLPGIVRRRLLADAAGNPLALLELPGSLTDRQRSGQVALPASLPLNARLEAAFTTEVERDDCPNRPAPCSWWPRWTPRRTCTRCGPPPRRTATCGT